MRLYHFMDYVSSLELDEVISMRFAVSGRMGEYKAIKDYLYPFRSEDDETTHGGVNHGLEL